MSKLTDLAFPFTESSNHENRSVSTGFTKHEYATIIIAANIAGNLVNEIGLSSFDHNDSLRIANIASNIAIEVLNSNK